ncbi:hypothetical protein [Leptospira bandrabouensis]|uniref:Phage major capsid protein n=1 Tax=Leptospira bandrabouensis TaxID=2484903 RepID=A0A6H3NQ26_9LEPT|nr:hypothetical protein [Leptospira bandrabouensis]TGN09977.1 hypothetical protein EHR07_00425 [Leptospira bandrabouensis]TGN12365.1 hypothetical protein EHR08_13365 [Leptospira bandrabouensis]
MSGSNINAYFKQIYGDAVNLVPNFAVIQKKHKFIGADKQTGREYVFPVKISHVNSITYAAPDNGGVVEYEPLNGMSTKSVKVQGASIYLRDRISIEDFNRASTGVKAFEKGTSLLVKSMIESGSAIVESQLLYGDTTLGVIEGSTNVSATRTTLQFSSASWASGLWVGGKGKKLEIYNTADTVKVTGVSFVTIVSVDCENRRLTVDSTAPEITALDTYLDSNSAHVYVKTAKGQSMAGLNKILTNTGELFGIDAGEVDLWRSSSYNVAGNISMAKVNDAIAVAMGRGCMEDLDLYLNPRAFNKLMSDQASQRKFDGSYSSKEAKNGFEALKFFSANGEISILPHAMVKEGEAFLIPPKQVKIIGANDWQWTEKEGDYFHTQETSPGKLLFLNYNGAVILQNPSLAVKLTGITYS